jgi:hypothetical protein
MSQIASAYGLSAEELGDCAQLFRRGEYRAFWERLRPFQIGPTFGYSGYVIVVVSEILRERGISLPVNRAAPGVEAFASGVVACASAPEAAAACQAITDLILDGAELAASLKGRFGERDAAEFFCAGLGWLRQVFQAGSELEWTLVWVG